MDKAQRQHGDLADWEGLARLSDNFIVAMLMWAQFDYGEISCAASDLPADTIRSDLRESRSALLRECERRGWPEGWWEDPSIVLGMAAEAPRDASGMEI